MHDPNILAHEIRYPWYHHKPWPKKFRKDPNSQELQFQWRRMSEAEKSACSSMFPKGYRNSFISIWHVDPCNGGGDDSCGYSYVRLTPHQRERLRNAAWSEGQYPHFLCCSDKEWFGSHSDAESLQRGIVFLVCRVLDLKITFDQAAKYASESIHMRDCGKYGSQFCYVAGYHSNNKQDNSRDRQEHFHGILCGVARTIITDRRPWWKHPKWHFWHWKFQVHPLQDFKRWAFTRCSGCRKGFKYGDSVCSNQWDSDGPRWFRSERGVFHNECMPEAKLPSPK